MSEGGALPPVIARMWGRETFSKRGPRPSLDLASILSAAIEIADHEGLSGVTMGSVATRVGMSPMSLYRYVGSKDELVLMMSDAAISRPPEVNGRGWRRYLAHWTSANRDLLVARPWLLEVVHRTPPTGPRTLLWLDRAVAALEETGLEAGERITVASTLTGYAASQARLTLSLGTGEAATGDELPATKPAGLLDYGRILGMVLDPGEYPALSSAVDGGAFELSGEWIEDADFTFGLDLLLDGIESLVSRRR